VHEFELPALLPQGTAEPVLTATYFDTDNVASPPHVQLVPIHDRRPPPVIDSAIGLFWTSAPGPSPDVQITAFNQSARQLSVDGEASTAALAYQFADKVKKNPELRTFQFDMAAPRILANDHAQFRLEGKPK
jgi:hypothetical protein